ncbi:hypothetical protein ESCO_006477 [Escovopsis weberi]|uniref:Nuclear transport factor 2 n=1 Tax=Escovopsis weberi TaxID=150374 RepID=A0A0M9VS73_ESCWE|nr:hypothetical protein ESCO_006477 [Escovopsis weberi]
MATQDQINSLCKEFLDNYYRDIQTADVAALRARYNETSQYSWESDCFVGPEAILQKISDLRGIGTFQNSSFSGQLRDNILIILATGQITMPGESHGMNFTECFVATVSRNEHGQLQVCILNQVSKLAL